jgi:hypothetical protein
MSMFCRYDRQTPRHNWSLGGATLYEDTATQKALELRAHMRSHGWKKWDVAVLEVKTGDIIPTSFKSRDLKPLTPEAQPQA